MYIYTQSHLTAVFLLGILNGILSVFIVKEIKSDFRVSSLVLKIILRELKKSCKRVIKSKTKVPTAPTVSTF